MLCLSVNSSQDPLVGKNFSLCYCKNIVKKAVERLGMLSIATIRPQTPIPVRLLDRRAIANLKILVRSCWRLTRSR
ncbi:MULTISPECIES: hypothetical protein [unclassified Microcoleus]|uniref:hypothetical protein n=1 Tax=unclassified Microcoleus TaxID=2642155 RepID=UPI002FD2AF2D